MIPVSRLSGLLLITLLMIPGAAWPAAPEENRSPETVDTQGETVDTQAKTMDTQAKTVDTQAKTVDTQGDTVDTRRASASDDERSREAADTPQTGASDEEGSGKAADDVFVPTEKVSEDRSVAFPVDI